jgi:hypothetical protein
MAISDLPFCGSLYLFTDFIIFFSSLCSISASVLPQFHLKLSLLVLFVSRTIPGVAYFMFIFIVSLIL